MGKPKNYHNPERQRTRFSKDFKLEAVRLLELSDMVGSMVIWVQSRYQ